MAWAHEIWRKPAFRVMRPRSICAINERDQEKERLKPVDAFRRGIRGMDRCEPDAISTMIYRILLASANCERLHRSFDGIVHWITEYRPGWPDKLGDGDGGQNENSGEVAFDG